MKDALGHGSNGKGVYNAATAAVHQTAVNQIAPSLEQFKDYRARQRETVHDLNKFYNGKPNTWAQGVIARARADHTASIARQRGVK